MCISEEETIQRNAVLARRAARRAPQVDAAGAAESELNDFIAEHVDLRRFGIECEFIGDQTRVQDAIIAAGDRCIRMGYNHETQADWKIVTDGSIRGAGGELVSPILASTDGMRRLRMACTGLTRAQARVNTSCGLHIHHEMHERSVAVVKNTLLLYAMNQSLINAMLAPSRRNNTYCRPYDVIQLAETFRNLEHTESNWATWSGRIQSALFDRYFVINTQSLGRYGTLEFRQHQGSTNFQRIAAWVRFGQAILRAAARGDVPIAFTSHTTLFETLHLSQEDRDYWMSRITYFANPTGHGTRE